MSDKQDGGQAFPLGANEYAGHGPVSGMSLRDYFAGKAILGILSCARDYKSAEGLDGRVRLAYEYVDAMLAERAK